jgi:putative ABC transport system substrate-binding protein
MSGMGRREFVALLGGAAAAWPLAARAQQPGGRRRLGVLMATAADDPESRKRLFALLQGMQQLGWVEGRNLRVDIRWAAGNVDDTRKYAAELTALAPDIILAAGSLALGPLLQATRTIPVVFTHVPDPVGAGFVDNMARPGGNATGFTSFDYGLSVKWLELLKAIAPRVTRVGVIRDPNLTAGIGQWGAIQGAAPAAGVEAVPLNVRDVAEIERPVAALARLGNAGLIVTASGMAVVNRDPIIALAARHKLPAVFWQRFFVADGGLISYGDDVIEHYRLAAGYIDRILKGEKPADLPVQLSTKLELVINLKTAKALGLEIPPTLLARADEVIE